MGDDPGYECWMKVSLNYLWALWCQDDMELVHPGRDPFTGDMRVHKGEGEYSLEYAKLNSYRNWPAPYFDLSPAKIPPLPPDFEDLVDMYQQMKNRRPVRSPTPLPLVAKQPKLDPSLSEISPVDSPVWKAQQRSLKLQEISNYTYLEWYIRNTEPASDSNIAEKVTESNSDDDDDEPSPTLTWEEVPEFEFYDFLLPSHLRPVQLFKLRILKLPQRKHLPYPKPIPEYLLQPCPVNPALFHTPGATMVRSCEATSGGCNKT